LGGRDPISSEGNAAFVGIEQATFGVTSKVQMRCTFPELTGTAGRIGKDDAREGASSSTAISDWNPLTVSPLTGRP
jgi:hypothetical protein